MVKERKRAMKATEKVINILESLLENEQGVTLGEMAELSGINIATARRIALILIERGYILQPIKRGRYSIGMKLLEYNKFIKNRDPIIVVANPYLSKMSKQVKETVFMNLWDGIKAINRLIIPVDEVLSALPREGRIPALHCTGIGKAIMAELPEGELQHHLGLELERYTPNTITNFEDFKNHLAIIRQEGVAYDDEEYIPGVRSVAAAIKDKNGSVVGAIAVIGPSTRLGPTKLKEVTPILKTYARLISEKL
jgi:DNA-binding IclR family transcriptional regulator